MKVCRPLEEFLKPLDLSVLCREIILSVDECMLEGRDLLQ